MQTHSDRRHLRLCGLLAGGSASGQKVNGPVVLEPVGSHRQRSDDGSAVAGHREGRLVDAFDVLRGGPARRDTRQDSVPRSARTVTLAERINSNGPSDTPAAAARRVTPSRRTASSLSMVGQRWENDRSCSLP